ncbi:MAG: DUF3500 domain-containing protein [Gammaproteobacteria bacterium]|nr:DUF3500 domain-containing protein [Gammaproteobacteria bacterium]MDE0651742.1 DUF3500 domain-containing protein [Gammaproteobacteria bacterium]
MGKRETGVVLMILLFAGMTSAGSPHSVPAEQEATAAAVAAHRFLATLDEAGREEASLSLDSPLKSNWSNLPAGILDFERNGVRVGDMTGEQRTALSAFLSTALSPYGADLVEGVMAAEGILAQSPRAARFAWSSDNYWLAFLGEPSAEDDWSWQFGGHHLAVNVAVRDGVLSMSPTFIGIEPANFEMNGSPAAPLQDQVADGIALMQSLPEGLRASSTVESRPREVYAGAGEDGVIPPLEGSRVADWPAEGKAQLLDVVGLWVRILPEAAAERRLAELREELDQVRFAWNGPYDGSGSIYYRIQGPNLILEFSTQGAVGSDEGHYHSVYRNPANEYGGGGA